MNKELLDILNELSKKDTTDLAMSCMELQADVLVKENEKEELQERIDKAINYLEEQKNTNQTIVDKTGWYIRDKVYEILKGGNKDIPGFEGTLEELDNLSIRGK